MLVLPDYEYYADHGGELSSERFAAVVRGAAYVVSHLTFGRSENPPAAMTERVMDCICKIVDIQENYRQLSADVPLGVASISNDGYSVTKGSNSGGSASNDEMRDCEAICRNYLLFPINLMYPGVRNDWVR